MFFLLFSTQKVVADDEAHGPWEEQMIDYNRYISKKIDWLADKIDLFLSRRRYTSQKNKTTATLRSFSSVQEGGEKDSSFNFDLNLRLPNLEERWQLTFTSYDPNEEERGIRSQRQRTQARETNYGAGLALLQELGDVKVTFRPRFELRDPLQSSYILRLESSSTIQPVRFDPKLELFADSQKGTGQFVALNVNFDLGHKFNLLQFNEEQYEDAGNIFTTTHGLSLSRGLRDRESLSLTQSFRSISQPHSFHLDDTTVSAGYSYEPYRQVLGYSLGPYWIFTKDQNFKGKVGFSGEIQLIF